MEASIQEWLNILLRWIHVIAAIMWVGDSFLFMWMDSHLSKARKQGDDALAGELWMVHSGGFYEVYKRKFLRPDELPPKLYWFKWESYTTWVSGFLLLIIVYFMGDAVLLVDPATSPLSPFVAVHVSLGLLVAGWIAYEFLATQVFQDNLRRAAWVGWPLTVALAYGLTHLFEPRAVYLQVGAMLGTIMAANVFFRIIPAQRRMLAATMAGRPVDTSYGVRAKQRSTHNHYMTLPVLFTMLSNHFPGTYGHKLGWLILGLLIAVGVVAKILMNRRGDTPKPVLALGLASFAGVVALTFPRSTAALAAAYADDPHVPFSRVQAIVTTRCMTCHAAHPTSAAFPVAPNGVMLDTPARVKAQAARVLARAVITETMPLANMTGMTPEERRELGAWVAQGARTDGATHPFTAAAPMPTGIPASVGNDARALYAARCALCHGSTGAGDGAAASALVPRPRNYHDPAWQASITDDYLRQVILDGGPAVGKSASMPANPDLADKPKVVDDLVAIIRAFGATQP